MQIRYLALLFALSMLNAGATSAQDFPSKPIRILTTEAGGGGDLVARVVGQGLSGALGQPVIIDNRGIRGAEIVAKAPRDGHTLLSYGNPLWLAPFLRDNVPYDPAKDFAPISLTVSSPNILVVSPSLRWLPSRISSQRPGPDRGASTTLRAVSDLQTTSRLNCSRPCRG